MGNTYKATNGEITFTDKGVSIQLDGKTTLVKYKEIKKTKFRPAESNVEGIFDVCAKNGYNYRLVFGEDGNEGFEKVEQITIKRMNGKSQNQSTHESVYFEESDKLPKQGWKTAKLVIGIVSMVLFFLIAFQSCAAGIGNALTQSGEISGTAGLMVAILMLIAGIVGVATRKSKGGGITTGVFYAVAGLIGIANYGSYGDLMIWSVLCFIFAVVFILGSIGMRK